MTTFLHTPQPWLPGKSNRRYGLTRGIYAQSEGRTIELGRMYIGSPEYEANFSLVLASPVTLQSLWDCPLPSTMGNVATHYQRFYDWYNGSCRPAMDLALTIRSAQ